MAEIIEKCFLIDIQDHKTFDSIIKILNDKNEVISLICLGVKKILSKNSRNLIFCSKLEIEYFRSRSKNSLSKLKRIKIQKKISDNYFESKPLIFLNWYIAKHAWNFSFNKYEKLIDYCNHLDEDTMMIIVLVNVFKHLGISINLNSCSLCSSKIIRTTSISKQGYLCKECSLKNNEYIHNKEFNEVFISIFNEQYSDLKIFKEKKELINFLKSYIYENAGLNIYQILEVK